VVREPEATSKAYVTRGRTCVWGEEQGKHPATTLDGLHRERGISEQVRTAAGRELVHVDELELVGASETVAAFAAGGVELRSRL
jgi:hypothetical protein